MFCRQFNQSLKESKLPIVYQISSMEFIKNLILIPFIFILELFYVIGYVFVLIGTLLRDNKRRISRQLKSQYGDRFKVESTKKRFGGVFVQNY